MEEHVRNHLERIVKLEKDLEWIFDIIPWALLVLGVLLAAFFGITLNRLHTWVDKKMRSTAIGIAEKKATTQVDAIEQARKEAEGRLAELRRTLDAIADKSAAHFRAVETGEFLVEFKQSHFESDRVVFSQRFEHPPIVLLGERKSRNWVFLKVDEVTHEGFRWAGRSIVHEKITYSTIVAWIAIAALRDD